MLRFLTAPRALLCSIVAMMRRVWAIVSGPSYRSPWRAATTLWASTWRPWARSHRGDSGRNCTPRTRPAAVCEKQRIVSSGFFCRNFDSELTENDLESDGETPVERVVNVGQSKIDPIRKLQRHGARAVQRTSWKRERKRKRRNKNSRQFR